MECAETEIFGQSSLDPRWGLYEPRRRVSILQMTELD